MYDLKYYLEKILLSNFPEFTLDFIRLIEGSNYYFSQINAMEKCKQNNPWHLYNVLEHTQVALIHSKNDLTIRLALLFHDVGKPECKVIGKDGFDHFYGHAKASALIATKFLIHYDYDKKIIHDVIKLIENHDIKFSEITQKKYKKLYNDLGFDLCMKLCDVRYADMLAQNQNLCKERIEYIKIAIAKFRILEGLIV